MSNYDKTTCDFTGWASQYNVLCSDNRVIKPGAFADDSGKVVPIVWNHNQSDVTNVLGHALLEDRSEGVYMYGWFNGTRKGNDAKESVRNKDIDKLSIYANHLVHNDEPSSGVREVVHGCIREVSLVLAGANPKARIDSILVHSEDGESSEEGYIVFDQNTIMHSDTNTNDEGDKVMNNQNDEKTVGDVIDGFTDDQLVVVQALIGAAVKEALENKKGGDDMKQNAFEGANNDSVLSHSEESAIFAECEGVGSLKETVIKHGITNVGVMFPEAQFVDNEPAMVSRDMTWVDSFLGGARKVPYSNIKSAYLDITADEARAKGYVKGNQKVEEVILAYKRITTPTTVYKLQAMDRDDLIDLNNFNAVAMLKKEMKTMLNEEVARAALVSDGRSALSNDKINVQNIRPIWNDDDAYVIKSEIPVTSSTTEAQLAKAFIRACITSRKGYKGSGNPTLYCGEDILTYCLLLEDTTGRVIYDSVEKLATALRVSKIVTVPVMDGLTRSTETKTFNLMGLIINPKDYTFGSNRGGEINFFDDFDIQYNKERYLIETRTSGALTVPYSAIQIETSTAIEADDSQG